MDNHAKNGAYRRSVELLLKLHLLTRDGQGETAEADDVRDASEEPWWQMSEEEKQRFRCLSEDLKTLEPDARLEHLPAGDHISEDGRRRIEHFLSRRDWEAILGFLRDHAEQVPADLAAYYRGRCWAELGDHLAAIEFSRVAAAHQVDFAPAQILPLVLTEQVSEAVAVTERLIARMAQMHPYSVLLLANSCCILADKTGGTRQRIWLQRAVDSFGHAFARIEEYRGRGIALELEPRNYVALALCQHFLGNRDEARRAAEKALELDPKEPHALILRGLYAQGLLAYAEPKESAEVNEIEQGLWNVLSQQAISPMPIPFPLAA